MTFVFWHITPKRNSRYDNVSGKWVRTDNPLRLENHLHKLD